VTALGVVYGDIGTSPLYAIKECFHGPHAIPLTQENVLGVLSLIVWALVLVVSVKYIAFVMRADNDGEGGILSLMALALRTPLARKRTAGFLVAALGLSGCALLFGEGVITPAISVLSAVEGLKVATPVFERWVVPLSTGVLIALFLFQRRGTAGIGRVFGGAMLVWFLSIALLGIASVARSPEVLAALNPAHAFRFFLTNRWVGFLALGAVVLVITGAEALYADMGHFGRLPIQLAWFAMVLPALLLNYFGQGALLLRDPGAADNPFYRLAPAWALYPLVGIATAAAVIASQALISGAFSLTRQAIQLGYIPRMEITHTSAQQIGQIYVSQINWALLIAVLCLVWGFRSSSDLAAAYGIAVTATMVITSMLSYVVATGWWGWNRAATFALVAAFLAIDLSFFSANALKFFQGGWFPVTLAAGVFTLMTTWKRGREILSRRLRAQSLPFESFLKSVVASPPLRVPGVAVYMTGNPEGTPTALLHNIKHNKVLHDRVVLLTISTLDVPVAPPARRLTITPIEQGFYRVIARYGFTEDPSVPDLLARCAQRGLKLKMMETSFFLGRETLIPTKRRGMALWREALFAWMSRNARSATSFFRIPPNRVVELGVQIEL